MEESGRSLFQQNRPRGDEIEGEEGREVSNERGKETVKYLSKNVERGKEGRNQASKEMERRKERLGIATLL